MKTFILVDINKIVRCIATEEVNLHDDKLHMDKHYVERQGRTGDEYDSATDAWISRPENYPQPTQDQANESKIEIEMLAIQRAEAIQSLIVKGDLPPDYTDVKG